MDTIAYLSIDFSKVKLCLKTKTESGVVSFVYMCKYEFVWSGIHIMVPNIMCVPVHNGNSQLWLVFSFVHMYCV